MHLPMGHGEISRWQWWIQQGQDVLLGGCSLFHFFFFCSLSLVCGVVGRDMNQGAELEIREVPAPETEGQREVGRQGSLN